MAVASSLDSSYRDRLDKARRDPLMWRLEAKGLLSSCRVLFDYWNRAENPYPGGEVAFPALLLGGYAIEDYAKARLLELANSWKGHGHDLPWLISMAGVSLDESETALVSKLREVVLWAGRYPAPFKAPARGLGTT